MKTATPFKISNEKNKLNLSQEIQRLKKEKNAVILAHYYQEEAIQEVADYLGDSLYLAKMTAFFSFFNLLISSTKLRCFGIGLSK